MSRGAAQPARAATTGRSRSPALGVRMGLVALLAAGGAALGIGVGATDGDRAAVDEPQYLLSALSLAEDGDLDISDELVADRARAFHPGPLPVQTQVQFDGSQLSPHDPLLPVLLAPAMGYGGWVGAKLVLAALAGALGALTLWVSVRRFGAPLGVATAVTAGAAASAPLAVYGQQVYPELPAALGVLGAVACLSGRLGRAGLLGTMACLVALPWLSVKYAPVAAVLAALAVGRLWREGRRAAVAAVAGTLAVAGVAFAGVHQALYGGWTAYASGDHFQTSGELTAVGLAPDYLGRGSRVVGLLVDRDFGLAAWQPAWLLVPAAAAATWRLLPRHRWLLLGPLLAGWLVATFAALTMHGFWWPGRQVVVVLPLAVVAVAVWLGALRGPAAAVLRATATALGAAGVAAYAWVLVAGWDGRLTWVGAPDEPVPAVFDAVRAVLPDYRVAGGVDWALHAGWVLVLVSLGVLGVRTTRTALGADRAAGGSSDRETAGAAGGSERHLGGLLDVPAAPAGRSAPTKERR